MAMVAGWRVAVVVLVTSHLGMGLSALIAHRLARPASRALQEASGLLKAEFSALSAAAPELQAYGARDWAVNRIDEKGQILDQASRKLASAGSWMMCAQAAALSVALVGVILTGPIQSPPLMALAILAAVTTLEGAGALLNALRQAGGVQAAVERLGELMPQAGAIPQDRRDQVLEPSIQLMTIDLKLSPPDCLAVYGRSGTGKTTLIERLMHLRPVIEGETLLGGSDVAKLSPEASRSLFSYAPQQPILLAGTVRANLKLARPDASDEDLWQALETADLAARIRRFPKGLDSALGENGARLSGGERRRLGLARAYLRPAPWLVLDEPTEGLDALTEARVLVRLQQHLHRTGQGLILISHRPGPLEMCNHRLEVSGLAPNGQVSLSTEAVSHAA